MNELHLTIEDGETMVQLEPVPLEDLVSLYFVLLSARDNLIAANCYFGPVSIAVLTENLGERIKISITEIELLLDKMGVKYADR